LFQKAYKVFQNSFLRYIAQTCSFSCLQVTGVLNISHLFDVDALWSVQTSGPLRHQAMLVTRGALNRFGQVNEIADMEKEMM